jgi:hypothetical protein
MIESLIDKLHVVARPTNMGTNRTADCARAENGDWHMTH